MAAQLSLGPILFHWPPEQWRDFYFRMADESPVDTVYIGEVVCSKRMPFYDLLYDDVAQRLQQAGKKVIFSTLAEVMTPIDRKAVEKFSARKDSLIEANDASALWHLSCRPHAIGPFMNAYNEDTLAFLAQNGAIHVCLPPELPATAIAAMAQKSAALRVNLEVQVYGRIPLALSARCYHARAHDRVKDNCQFVCGGDADGMDLKTLQGKPFLTVNGIQTMSHTCLNLIHEMKDMMEMGISRFRLSPHSHDMAAVAGIFHGALQGRIAADEADAKLAELRPDIPFSNGFFHKTEGWRRERAA